VIPAMKVLKPGNILQNMQRLEYLTAVLINRIISRLSSVYVAPGPFSVYKAAVLRELGGFSENDLTEDQEIAYRTQLHQYGIVQCPLTEVYTRAPSNLIELFRQRSRWYRGSIVNLFRYRKMMLNRKYGHFGLFQMPLNFISFLLSALTILFASYFIIWPIVKAAYHLYIVGFDIKPYLLNLSLSIDLLGFDAGRTFLAATMLIIAFIILLKALSNSGEKIRAPNIPQFFIYFLFYYLILGFFCLVAVGDLIIRRNLKW
jgi:cellulose synthase/poly-beta-1,6-N-acetylglucosamine synthase-like glycosyltransferase